MSEQQWSKNEVKFIFFKYLENLKFEINIFSKSFIKLLFRIFFFFDCYTAAVI